MSEIWEMQWGCQWNAPLYQYECHGLDVDGKVLCPHIWTPTFPFEDVVPKHDPKCPIGQALARKKSIMAMEVVVDRAIPPLEIRVADPAVAEWLKDAVHHYHTESR